MASELYEMNSDVSIMWLRSIMKNSVGLKSDPFKLNKCIYQNLFRVQPSLWRLNYCYLVLKSSKCRYNGHKSINMSLTPPQDHRWEAFTVSRWRKAPFSDSLFIFTGSSRTVCVRFDAPSSCYIIGCNHLKCNPTLLKVKLGQQFFFQLQES